MDWQKESQEVRTLKSHFEHVDLSLKEEEQDLAKSNQLLKDTEEAQSVLQHLAQSVQQQAHKQVTEIVSSCLKLVFGEDAYSFKITFDRKRGRTEAKLQFERNGIEFSPLSSTGGGAVDVAAFALRISSLILHRPRLRKLLVLDEPFRFLSAEYRENVRSMLEGLSNDLKLQIILVTHEEAYETGKIHHL